MAQEMVPTSSKSKGIAFNDLTKHMLENVEFLCSFVTVNGHIMVGQIGLVYITPQWFDENMLHSPSFRLAANVILQFDVLPQHNFSLILYCPHLLMPFSFQPACFCKFFST